MTDRGGSRVAEGEPWWIGGLIVLAIVGLVVLIGGGGDPDEGAPEPTLVAAPVTTSEAAPDGPAPVPTAAEVAFDNEDGRSVVCLDAGHGGTDEGHERRENGEVVLEEKDLTLTVAQILADRLPALDIEPVMTRTGDTVVNAGGVDVNGDGIVATDPDATSQEADDLQARINICNAANADLLLSIHFNGADNTDLNGYETFYDSTRPFGDRSERFAYLLYEQFGRQMLAAGYPANPHGVGADRDYAILAGAREFLVPSQMPGVLGEGLYLSNDDDARFILSQGALFAVALAYEEAIVQYFAEYPG